jgi:phospholipid/cholesterol/gamma-HCH transport system permease protein
VKEPESGLAFDRAEGDLLRVRLSGQWKIGRSLPPVSDLTKRLESEPGIRRLTFDSQELAGWDSGLLTFLAKLFDFCSRAGVQPDPAGLPQGVTRLLALATAVPEQKEARRHARRAPLLERLGESAVGFASSIVQILEFLGEIVVSLARMLGGRARFRRTDLWAIIEECGAEALPIVSLISILVGLILAFVGAIQLRLFGAQIYVANLVGIAMVRAMGAIMTGIIMTGRTGASFAARIGTMQVNEEIDALKTAGISPIDFLVLPRVLALALMMPLLTLYADLMGILGGLIVAVVGLDINVLEYYAQTKGAVGLTNVWIGVFMGFVFGILVALAGCLRGMQCGRSASAVGDATTSAVVTGIVSIIVATAIITVLCDVLGI